MDWRYQCGHKGAVGYFSIWQKNGWRGGGGLRERQKDRINKVV